jgi:hypothetical protein
VGVGGGGGYFLLASAEAGYLLVLGSYLPTEKESIRLTTTTTTNLFKNLFFKS